MPAANYGQKKKSFTSREKIYKWLCYFGAGFLLFLLQSVGFMPPILGVFPSFMLCLPFCIAICEGPAAGAAAGAVCGILSDVLTSGMEGLFSLLLVVTCALTGVLVQAIMRNTIVTALVLTTAGVSFIKIIEWYLVLHLTGIDPDAYVLVNSVLPSVLYTVLLITPVYFLILWIKSRFNTISD